MAPPLIVFAFDGGIAPLDGHARGEGYPCRMGFDLAQVERGHVFDLPAPVVGSDLDGLDGREFVPCLGVSATGGQVNFERLEDDGDVVLDGPDCFLMIGCEQLLGFAEMTVAPTSAAGGRTARYLLVESIMGALGSPTSTKSVS